MKLIQRLKDCFNYYEENKSEGNYEVAESNLDNIKDEVKEEKQRLKNEELINKLRDVLTGLNNLFDREMYIEDKNLFLKQKTFSDFYLESAKQKMGKIDFLKNEKLPHKQKNDGWIRINLIYIEDYVLSASENRLILSNEIELFNGNPAFETPMRIMIGKEDVSVNFNPKNHKTIEPCDNVIFYDTRP